MARPRKLTGSQRKFIVKLLENAKNEDRKLTSPQVVKEVTEFLVGKEKAKHKADSYDSLRKIVVDEQLSPTAIQKFVTETYIRMKNSEFDKPWHLACMRNPEYAIHPEAIPHLIRVQRWQRDNDPGYELNIRQAKWIGILYATVPKVEDLYHISLSYALWENTCDLVDILFDTSKPDMMLPDANKVFDAFVELRSSECD